MARLFVGRGAELQRLRRLAEPRGTRSVPVVVGPSGVGKTSLAEKLVEALNLSGGYTAFIIHFISRPESLKELAQVLRKELLENVAAARLSHVVREVVAGLVEKKLGVRLGLERRPALEDLYELLSGLVDHLEGRRVVLVLDEAQLLVESLEGELWGFVKMAASLQERYPGRFQAILVTSDFGFQRRLYREAPSPDYVETFYLGEMTRGDAAALAQRIGLPPEGAVFEALGGHPVHLLQAGSYPDGPEAFYRLLVRKYRQIIREELHPLISKKRFAGSGVEEPEMEEALSLLSRLAVEPLNMDEALPLEAKTTGLLDRLVKRGVLQYGCSDYLGVYFWNPDCRGHGGICGGGGVCGGLDVIGPSSRAALAALAAVVKAAGRLDEARAPGWLRPALGLAGL